jgi:hypothetical protein
MTTLQEVLKAKRLSPSEIKRATATPTAAPAIPKGMVAMRDERGVPTGKLLEMSSGKIFDPSGHDTGDRMDRDAKSDRYDKILARMCSKEYYADVLAKSGRRECSIKERDGRLIKMDLAPTDVHVDSLLPNFNGGYHLADGAADVAVPVIVTDKNSNKYNVWDQRNAFKRVLAHSAAAGAEVPEVNPVPSFSQYSCLEYALGAFITLEVQANADVPLQPLQAGVKRVLTVLRLEREIRAATLLRTTGNWNTNMVQSLNSSTKWNASTGDPVANIHQMIEQSAMSVDRLVWSELVLHEVVRNSNFKDYSKYKDSINPIPVEQIISERYGLPPITTVKMKYNLPSGSGTYRNTIYPYVWAGDVIGIHEPPQMPPMSQDDVCTACTFRWNGANQSVRDGEYSAGFLVRTFWDQKRGGRGGMKIVVVHNDTEVMPSNLVGGLIVGAVQ